jgi:hypothetical protein
MQNHVTGKEGQIWKLCMVCVCVCGGEEIMYGYAEPNNLHTPTRQDTAVYCHLLSMEISMMTKTNYSLDIMNCVWGGGQQTLLLGGIHTGNNFNKGSG